jgi:peptidoglycan pentaglycine glycine transferase (the first glycine)
MKLIEISDRQAWDQFITTHPNGHPLQLWGWGEAKRENGWVAHRLVLEDGGQWVGGCEVLLWSIPKLGRKIAYAPRGPVVAPATAYATELLNQIAAWARTHQALYARIEPAWTNGKPPKGWIRSRHHVQLPETYTIDLAKSDEELLEPMSRKHRQYIRKSERDGVTIERITGDDLSAMFEIYCDTAQRAGFGIHTRGYYETLHSELGDNSYLYYAVYNGKPVAFLWLAIAGQTAYELYGGVNVDGAEIKANYSLKWHAILAMKERDLKIYDFNGRLNEGVSRFKEGFGPTAADYIGTWDYPISKFVYRAWENLWPVIKVVGRQIAKSGKRSNS